MPLILLNVLCGNVKASKPRAVNSERIISIEQEREADPDGTPAVARITLEGGRIIDVLGTVVEVLEEIEDQADDAAADRANTWASAYIGRALTLTAANAADAPPPQEENPVPTPDPAATPTT